MKRNYYYFNDVARANDTLNDETYHFLIIYTQCSRYLLHAHSVLHANDVNAGRAWNRIFAEISLRVTLKINIRFNIIIIKIILFSLLLRIRKRIKFINLKFYWIFTYLFDDDIILNKGFTIQNDWITTIELILIFKQKIFNYKTNVIILHTRLCYHGEVASF